MYLELELIIVINYYQKFQTRFDNSLYSRVPCKKSIIHIFYTKNCEYTMIFEMIIQRKIDSFKIFIS